MGKHLLLYGDTAWPFYHFPLQSIILHRNLSGMWSTIQFKCKLIIANKYFEVYGQPENNMSRQKS